MPFLPTYQELKSQISLFPSAKLFIEQSRQTIRKILFGQDPRLLLIVGPCSIHDISSAKEYARRLKILSEKISNHFFIIMRAYCEKPRTASGWKGYLYDPYLDGSHDMKVGIQGTRQLLLDLAEMEVPTATEFLDPLTAHYYDDLISWGSIGARTSSSQPHRQLASGLTMPIGFKNGVAGNVSSAINGVISASYPHTYMGINEMGVPYIMKTKGNKDCHVVLRGGENGPNYDSSSVLEVLKKLDQHLLQSLLIDCSHHNSSIRRFKAYYTTKRSWKTD